MKHCFTLISILFIAHGTFCQITPIPTSPGTYGQVVRGVSTISGGIFQAKMEQDRRKEQEELDEYYNYLVNQGDTLYKQKNYSDAIVRYNEASQLKQQEQYPRDQVTKAKIAQARAKRDPYQLLVDKGDSLFTEMYYEEAIGRYNEALTIKQEPYPNTRIAEANAELARWKTIHFSGLPITDSRIDTVCSKAYSNDPYSDFVQPGKYSWIDRELTYSNFRMLDGIAVPAGMRLIIYSERDFKGAVLLDVTGPAIISNITAKQPALTGAQSNNTSPRLQTAFPEKNRTWSNGDMHQWVNGSMEILAL
jgi:hypothetical protein